jgi:hypothetical protein
MGIESWRGEVIWSAFHRRYKASVRQPEVVEEVSNNGEALPSFRQLRISKTPRVSRGSIQTELQGIMP